MALLKCSRNVCTFLYHRKLRELKENEGRLLLLQQDQASQLEAFKEEWRQEQAARAKWEKNYNDLLQTWQAFE